MVQAEGEWLKPPHRVLLSLQQSKAIASALLSARMPSLLVKGKAEGVGGWGTIARRCFSMGRSIAPENTIKPIGRTAPVLVLKASPPRRLLGYRERVAARGGGGEVGGGFMVRRVFVFVDRYQHRKFPVTIGIIVSIEAAVNLAVPVKVKGVPRPPVNFRLIFSLIRYRYSLASSTCSPSPLRRASLFLFSCDRFFFLFLFFFRSWTLYQTEKCTCFSPFFSFSSFPAANSSFHDEAAGTTQ